MQKYFCSAPRKNLERLFSRRFYSDLDIAIKRTVTTNSSEGEKDAIFSIVTDKNLKISLKKFPPLKNNSHAYEFAKSDYQLRAQDRML